MSDQDKREKALQSLARARMLLGDTATIARELVEVDAEEDIQDVLEKLLEVRRCLETGL